MIYFDEKLKRLAERLKKPLYAVGGYVRNNLSDGLPSADVDLAAAIPAAEFAEALHNAGLKEVGVYKRTGTVLFTDGVNRYEYTAFRKENYGKGGAHTPESVEFTDDITLDAKRRDFKCNAVYYDIKRDEVVDVLGGVKDIKNRILDTVTSPKEVFSHDGLRLLRLARFSGELNFTPAPDVILGAREFASNVKDISAERVYAELQKILISDGAYPFSDKNGHYTALKILSETRVLDYILPELTLGRGMPQPAAYHDYDVLEHSLKTVLYADKPIRLAALLHDAGKPACYLRAGNYHNHDRIGAEIAEKILCRLKASNKIVAETVRLVGLHMADLKCDMKTCKVRRKIVENADIFDKLMLLKTADYKACKNRAEIPPTVERWKKEYEIMKNDGTPFSLNELTITAEELLAFGVERIKLGKALKELFLFCVDNPENNEKARLFAAAKRRLENGRF